MRFRPWIAVGGTVALALALLAHARSPALAQITIPPGYRDWRLISVAILGSPDNDIRAILGNDSAITTFRTGKIQFPDGAIIARLAWKQVADPEGNGALRHEPLSPASIQKLLSGTFVAGSPTNLQFMVKNSTRYAATGGWGFEQFTKGKPDAIVQRSCWECHALAGNRGFVFTRYSP